ncbi:MAG: hypothetical protein AABZ31_07705, partial [Bdellovibrionota bacterium]
MNKINHQLKHLLLLAAILFIGISAFANPYVTFEKQYAELTKLSNQTDYVYRLSPEQIAAAYDIKDQRALLNELIEKISLAGGKGGYEQAIAREEFNDKYVAPRVNHLLSMSKAQINLAIMTLSRDLILTDDR